jgi:hypothetical protein
MSASVQCPRNTLSEFVRTTNLFGKTVGVAVINFIGKLLKNPPEKCF